MSVLTKVITPREAPSIEIAGSYQEEVIPKPTGKTLTPQPRLKTRWWMPRVRHLEAKVRTRTEAKWLFVGDSITENWFEAGNETWKKYFSVKAINVGVAGDRTENILWRLQNGHMPKNCNTVRWVVVLAGTNNLTDGDTSAEVARGIGGIVNLLLDHCSNARILLMGVFPRSGKKFFHAIRDINNRIAQLQDNVRIFYLDIGDLFLNPDGSINTKLLPDGLHLSSEGYHIWARALLPFLENDNVPKP